jgi:hypothetical protein
MQYYSMIIRASWVAYPLRLSKGGQLFVLPFAFRPKHLKRMTGQGDLHFITFCCYHRRRLRGTAHARNLTAEILGTPARFRSILRTTQRQPPCADAAISLRINTLRQTRR